MIQEDEEYATKVEENVAMSTEVYFVGLIREIFYDHRISLLSSNLRIPHTQPLFHPNRKANPKIPLILST